MIGPESLRFDDRGLVPAVVQDATTRRVLMLAYVSREALQASLETGQVHFWSRSRRELWRKGATSGNTLELVDLRPDCDGDALLVLARPAGPTCHRGTASCFDAAGPDQGFAFLEELWSVIAERAAHRPPGSYTTSLLQGGVDAVTAKLTEEAGELSEAARSESPERVAEEAADLLYHLLVLLASRDLEPRAAIEALEGRRPDPETP